VPKVSVLISAFNAEETIKRCLDSIFHQTHPDFEVILVNDGSSDRTMPIVKAFKDKRLHIIDMPHVGLPKALNAGLKQCKGQYIARMDADDWSYPDRFALQADVLDNDPRVEVVCGLVEYAGNRDKNEGYARHVDWVNSLQSHEEMFLNRFEDSPVVNPSSMFRKNLIDKYGNYTEEPIPEDYEFWMRLFHHKVMFHKIQQPVLKWYDLAKRITRNSDNYSVTSFQKVKASYLDKQLDLNAKDIFVFGTGKTVDKKIAPLLSMGININNYLEVKAGPYASKEVTHYTNLPKYTGQELVLSYVGDREGKVKIKSYLEALGYTLGRSYFLMC